MIPWFTVFVYEHFAVVCVLKSDKFLYLTLAVFPPS